MSAFENNNVHVFQTRNVMNEKQLKLLLVFVCVQYWRLFHAACVHVSMYVCVCVCVCMCMCMRMHKYVYICVCVYRRTGKFREHEIFAVLYSLVRENNIREKILSPRTNTWLSAASSICCANEVYVCMCICVYVLLIVGF